MSGTTSSRAAERRQVQSALALTTMAAAVVHEEARQGLSVFDAGRPMHDHEVRAGIRFGDIDAVQAQTVERITTAQAAVWAAAEQELLAAVREAATTPEATLLLAELASHRSGPGLPLDRVLDDALEQVLVQLQAAQMASVALVLDEARSQGVPAGLLPAVRDLRPSALEVAGLRAAALGLVEEPVSRLLSVARVTARARPVDGSVSALVDELASVLPGVSRAGAEDLARQAATRAVGQGRAAVGRGGPVPSRVYASELLDGRQCGPCEAVDGREYASLEEALVDYPAAGGYVHCEGGPRCRGTLVFVWDEAVASVSG
jgi:hypothetical protein